MHTKPDAQLPPPDIYEQEYAYWPWGRLIDWVANEITRVAPPGGLVVDYMCGTGYLLNKIGRARPDLRCAGCCINPAFVEFGQRQYGALRLTLHDARAFVPPGRPSVTICTAGLHHLTFADQEPFIRKMINELGPDGYLFIGEEVLGEFANERERKLAVAALWHGVLEALILREAPQSLIEAALTVLRADLSQDGEYKCSDQHLRSVLERHCRVTSRHRVWPEGDSGYGDVVYVCRPLESE